MDSVNQFVLGAGIGTAVLGRRIGVRKAAITGGLLATLPDIDVFWPYENDVARFTQHRSVTHSLILHTLATPLIGEVVLLLRDLRGRRRPRATGMGGERRPWSSRGLAYLAVFLCLTTHALLDTLAVYGTQLFWPVWNEPLALGSIFIIEPAYTLPLLMIALWAFFKRDWTKWFGRALTVALLLSTAYLAWSIVAQQITLFRADKLLAAHGVNPTQRISTPTAFNTLFWRVIAMDGSRYFSIYVPLLAGEEAITAYVHQTSPADATDTNAATAATSASLGCVGNNQQAKTLRLSPMATTRFAVMAMILSLPICAWVFRRTMSSNSSSRPRPMAHLRRHAA